MMTQVTNDQLYELLKEFKADMNQFKTEMYQFKSDTQRGLSQLDFDLRALDQRTQRLETKVDGIHVSWNHKLVGSVLATSVTASALVALLMQHVS